MSGRAPWLLLLVATTAALAGCTSTLSKATSPDGRWTVEVEGQRMALGAIEVSMRTTGPDGYVESAGVIDLCDGWKQAREMYGTIDVDNEGAVVHGRLERFPREGDPAENTSPEAEAQVAGSPE
jgi:hypothetical protein